MPVLSSPEKPTDRAGLSRVEVHALELDRALGEMASECVFRRCSVVQYPAGLVVALRLRRCRAAEVPWLLWRVAQSLHLALSPWQPGASVGALAVGPGVPQVRRQDQARLARLPAASFPPVQWQRRLGLLASSLARPLRRSVAFDLQLHPRQPVPSHQHCLQNQIPPSWEKATNEEREREKKWGHTSRRYRRPVELRYHVKLVAFSLCA